jgi:hypothetical protein
MRTRDISSVFDHIHLTKWTRRLLMITSIYCAASFLVVITIQLAWCHPINRNWYVNYWKLVEEDTKQVGAIGR